jgi:DNA-binding CsgD family transcriptional regulator
VTRATRQPQLHVSRRQAEILRLVAAGFSDKEIGVELNLSPHTVRSHLHRLYRERGVKNRAEAVAAWLGSSTSSR